MLSQEVVRVLPPAGGRALIAESQTASNDDWVALAESVVVAEEVWTSESNDREAVHPSGPGQWTPALEYAACCCDL